MFIPTTISEVMENGWDRLDIILVSGDTYIDSSYNGIAIIGKLLIDKGYRVGIIAQPDINCEKDITRLGEPELFWGISSGSNDSMVSNYTANYKKRNMDDLTPGGINNRRPDRALIVYSNLIRRYFKNTVPLVLGGLEASLRRIAHYDFWSNKVRRSILFDSKADFIIYGMGEKQAIEVADFLKEKKDVSNIKGLCYISNKIKDGYIELPSYENVITDKKKFIEMFNLFYNNNDPFSSKGLIQKHNDRYLIHNPPVEPLTTEELDYVYNLTYERRVHPYYKKHGEVRALNTIQFSITTHRGCVGECNFCSIFLHQGRKIISRSEESILKEVKDITKHPEFKGIINDVGGPTSNMYMLECTNKNKTCKIKRCLLPEACNNLKLYHDKQIKLLEKIKNINGVKKVFASSGLRYDLVLADKKNGRKFLENLLNNYISGQLKIAPEHTASHVLKLMGKPENEVLEKFLDLFNEINKKLRKKIFLTYYFIVSHPGCNEMDIINMKNFIKKELKINPEQVQIFTPTPSTYSTLMYYTGIDPFTNKKIFVEKNKNAKEKQKNMITRKNPLNFSQSSQRC